MNKPKLITAGLLALVAGCDQDVGPGRWDNPLDPEGSNYAPPNVVLNDTAIRNPTGGRITAHAASRNSTIASVRWIRNDTLLAGTDTSLPTDGWNDGWHSLSAQVQDANGLSSRIARIGIWIGNRLPELRASYSPVVSAHAAATINLSADDPDGTIASIAWDTVPDRYAFGSREFELRGSAGTRKSIYAKAVDNDGATVTENLSVLFAAPPVVRAAPDLESSALVSASGSGGSWTAHLTSSVLPILVGAGTPGLPDASLEVVVKEGSSTYPCISSSHSFLSGFLIQDEQRFECSLEVTDSPSRSLVAQVVSPYGDTTTSALFLTIQR